MRPGSCLRQPLSLPKPFRSMRRAIATALPIVLTLILLPPIAFASPPDPSWIAGFYDGADGDDIVCLVCETSAISPTTPSHLGPLPCLLEMPLEGIACNVPDRYYSCDPRSPPVLRSLEFGYVFNSLPPPTSGAKPPAIFQPLGKFRPSWSGDLQTLRVAIELARHDMTSGMLPMVARWVPLTRATTARARSRRRMYPAGTHACISGGRR